MPHVLAQDLRNAVLQAAMQGKLTEQLDSDTQIELKQINTPLDDDIPFDLPETWKWCTLQDVAKTYGGYAFKSSEYVNDGIRVIRISDFNENGFVNNSIVRYTFNEKLSPYILKDNDILMCMTGGTVGKTYCTTKLNEKMYLNQRVAAIRNIAVDIDYLRYYVRSPFIKDIVDKKKNSTNDNISMVTINTFPFPLPPIEEQSRIVARVDELMAKIDEYEKIEKELTELQKAFPGNMKDAILQAAMQGKLTEQLAEDTDINEYYKEILSEKKIVTKKEKEVPFVGDEPFDIPSSWMWVQLNDLVGKEIRRGKSPTYAKTGEAMAFAQKCNSKYTGIRLDLALCLDDKSLSRYAEHDRLYDMDVVINSTGGGTLGRVGLYKDVYNPEMKAYYPDSHVTVVRAKKCVNPLYIFRCLQFYSPYLETLGEGSTNQTELKADVVKGLYIPLPPLEEQQRIVDKLDQLLPLCEQLEKMAA